MLEKRLKNEITPFQFQKYILECWSIQLYDNKILKGDYKSNNIISIYERTPEDSVCCFAYLDKINGRVSNELYNNLIVRCTNLQYVYKFPSIYKGSKITTIENSSNVNLVDVLNKVLNIIQNDLDNNIKNRIILIDGTLTTTLTRIAKRKRNGEENYDIETLGRINYRYCEWFSEEKNNIYN